MHYSLHCVVDGGHRTEHVVQQVNSTLLLIREIVYGITLSFQCIRCDFVCFDFPNHSVYQDRT
jgi:hypothetical protein